MVKREINPTHVFL